MRPKNITKENRRFVQGALIINAPSASFNLGEDGIKRVRVRGEDGKTVMFSYLSGQFIKAKIKETLKDFGEILSKPEIIQEKDKKNTPTTSCNPFVYLDDDLFGYMNVIETGNHINSGTTRIAPFKISYFLGKEGDITKDFAVKQDGALKDGELTTMPLNDNNRYFASTTYSGCFSLDVNFAGRFFRGSTAGFKNLAKTFPIEDYKENIVSEDDYEIALKNEIRLHRIQKLINSIPKLYGGARQATVYSDLAPKFVVYCVTNNGNHLFQEIANIYNHLNITALIEGVTDFKESLKSDIYIALKQGFLESKRRELITAVEEYNSFAEQNGKYKFIYNENISGINDITQRFTKEALTEMFKTPNI